MEPGLADPNPNPNPKPLTSFQELRLPQYRNVLSGLKGRRRARHLRQDDRLEALGGIQAGDNHPAITVDHQPIASTAQLSPLTQPFIAISEKRAHSHKNITSSTPITISILMVSEQLSHCWCTIYLLGSTPHVDTILKLTKEHTTMDMVTIFTMETMIITKQAVLVETFQKVKWPLE